MVNKPELKQDGGLKQEVSTTQLLIVVGVLVLLVGGYFVFKNARAPKFLTGNTAAAKSAADRDSHIHKDEVTAVQTTKD